MCQCKENNWCRDWAETTVFGIGFPPSEHAPRCDEYKLEEFAVIEHEGTKCVFELYEADSFEGDDEYSVTTIQITRDQFEKLPEFQGF